MWNSQKPLELLLSMPSRLTKENVESLQAVINVDKSTNSEILGRDLCGEYAPFCDYCDKSVYYPCANAYVKMKKSEGLDVEVPEEIYDDLKVAEYAVEEVSSEPDEVDVEEVEETPKKRIRIAIAKKTR